MMTDLSEPIAINPVALSTLGRRLYEQFLQYEKDKFPLEQQFMRNVRQYRGIYDPEVKIRPNGSTAYPKLTRKWVNGTLSRLMHMLFPQTERNWSIEPTPIPDLPRADLQSLLDEMAAGAEQAGVGMDDATIEQQIMVLANQRCERMRLKMEDQLSEMEYVTLVRRVLFSGVLYGVGLLSGPLLKEETVGTWKRDAETGRYIVSDKKRLAPWFQSESVWEWYPDLSAKNRGDQDGHYFRRIMSRDQVRKLADRPDFLADQVKTWLRDHTTGNFKERAWETEIRVDGDRKYTSAFSTRKYEVLEWWGHVSGHELVAAGVNLGDKDLSEQYEGNVFMIDSVVIKAIMNPLEKRRRPLNQFVFEEDDISLSGVGLPQVVRDSQLSCCESARMLLDNASVICTPSKLIKLGLLMPGHNLDSAPYKDWYQDPDAPDNTQDAVRNLTFDGHLEQLSAVFQLFKSVGEEESSLPPVSMGDLSGGGSEAGRTQGNLSMLMGAASLPIRDTVRNFDSFTEGVMTGLYDWNMEFDDDPKNKGDFNVIALGSTSLMAKEVRAQHIVGLSQSIQPEEREHVNWRELLTERIHVTDMSDEILLPQDQVDKNNQQKAAQQQEIMEQQKQLITAQIRETLSAALKNAALAKKADTSADVGIYQAMIEGIQAGLEAETGAAK